MNTQHRSLLGGLACAGLLFAPSLLATGAQQGGDAERPTRQERTGLSGDTRLELKLQPASSISFRVKRDGKDAGLGMPGERGTGRDAGQGTDRDDPGGAQDRPGQPGGMSAMGARGMTDLRLDLRPERASGEGTTMIRVEVSRGGDAMKTKGGAGELGGTPERGAGERGGADTGQPSSQGLASFRVLVDDDGRILRMEEATVAAGENADPGQTRQRSQGGALDKDLLRSDLAVILGTGLHGVPLKEGMNYAIGGDSPLTARPVEASGPRGSAGGPEPRSFQVRFEELRDARQVTGATEGRIAAFVVLPEDDVRGLGQPGRGEPGRGTDEREDQPGRGSAGRPGAAGGEPIGRALYSLDDGLLTRFEVRLHPGLQGRVNRPGGEERPGRDDDEPGRGDDAGLGSGAQGRGLGAAASQATRSLTIERIESGATGAAGGR